MAPNLSSIFLDQVKMEILFPDEYTSNEIYAFARRAIDYVHPLLKTDNTTTDGTSVWDYTISGTIGLELLEIYKLATVLYISKDRMRKMIADGVGASFSVGSERVDTKTILITVREIVKDTEKTLREKILAYNLTNVNGSAVDTFATDLGAAGCYTPETF